MTRKALSGSDGVLVQLKTLRGLRSASLIDAQWRCVLELVDQGESLPAKEDVANRETLADVSGVFGAAKDIVISLVSTFHIARPLRNNPELVVHVVLSRAHGSIGEARRKMVDVQEALERDARQNCR